MHCILETAKEKGIDLVLMQEPPQRNDPSFRPSHPGFTLLWSSGRTCAARRIDSPWAFSLEESNTRETAGDAQVIAMKRRGSSKTSCRIINTYFRKRADSRARPAEQCRWEALLGEGAGPALLVGDFNAHSPVWNPRCGPRRDARFLEDLIDTFSLMVLIHILLFCTAQASHRAKRRWRVCLSSRVHHQHLSDGILLIRPHR